MMDSVATGSTAEMRDPKMSASMGLRLLMIMMIMMMMIMMISGPSDVH
jgi:hypothetical protein